MRALGQEAETLSAQEALTLANTLLMAGHADDAAVPIERALEAKPPHEVRSRLHLALAQIARTKDDARLTHRHLLAVAAPVSERLDARLLWCWLHRAQDRPQVALKDYLSLLRALQHEEPAAWWKLAEETAHTFVETGDRAAAKRFLEQLRKKDRSFGADPARRKRLIALMRKLDAR